jgi:hypothetical protein
VQEARRGVVMKRNAWFGTRSRYWRDRERERERERDIERDRELL